MMDLELGEINRRAFHGATDCSRDSETVIEVNDSTDSNVKSIGSAVINKVEKDKSLSCSIDVNTNEYSGENQRVCRICHLNAKESGNSLVELMEIGCHCKGELGVAHLHCAEAWFRLKGNRLCEICGETAKNITGLSDNGFMEEWYERRGGDTASDESRRCLRGQPLCNFLMACLVIAFVLPWFFRVNMF